MLVSPYFLIWPLVITSAILQAHTKPPSRAHPRSQQVLLAGLAAAGHKALQTGFESTLPCDTSRKRCELLWSYTVGSTWRDIQSCFLRAALTISVSPCFTQALFRISHVKYLIHAKCVVTVLHQQNQSSWIAVGFTHTHLLYGKSLLAKSFSCCWQEGWAVQQQQGLPGLWSVTNYKTPSCTWS